MSAATFINMLDTSIANVWLPVIDSDLGVSPNQGTWVSTSFGAANTIAVPLTGWLSQRFGQVRLFTASIMLFMITSWLCGLAPNMTTLIFFRVLQGLVAGQMIPLSQALLLSSYPKAQSGLAMALWSMTTLVVPVMGPLLGGWITDNISWPWIFYINIPVGFGTLHIMLDKGKELDWFHSGEVIALGFVALVGLIAFVIWKLTEEHPVVELSLFKRRNFWPGALALPVGYGLFFGNVVLLPLWLQQDMGYTATQAGMVLALLLSPLVGKNIGKTYPRRFAIVAFSVFALVLWMRLKFNTQADIRTILIPTIIRGVAMACFFIPLVTITLSGLPYDKIPAALGLSDFLRILAGSFST